MGTIAPSTRDLLQQLREGPAGAEAEAAGRRLTELLVRLRETGALLDDPPAPEERAPAPPDETLELLAEGRLDAAVESGLDLDALLATGKALAEAAGAPEAGEARDRAVARAHAWLDAVRRPALLRRIRDAEAVEPWLEVMLLVVDASRFTVARLLEQRVDRYGPRTLFRVPRRGRETAHSWLDASNRVDQIARGLLALTDEHGRAPIAVLSENRLEMALVDLACLSTGLVNLMIPAPTTDLDVAYILSQAQAGYLVVSTERQLKKVERHRHELPALKAVILLDAAPAGMTGVLSLSDLAARGLRVPEARLRAERAAVELEALATVMYTSGTTGKPKGIRFTQRNIVSKRFARALALPDVGDHDVFLCFLPLFHTFGRFFEMMGSVFWGASYVFLEDPSLETLRDSMQTVRPTIFISVPKKWIELWEEIGRRVDLEEDPDEVVRAATREVVGDRLRCGLSAAGYLAPEIFRFFQRQGVELMSGFGMTEATGGITMTPPDRYRDDTLGVPLPGIEVKLAADGEMMIRGPYVMVGYHESPEGTGLDEDGWLPTGDLMEQDEAGYYRLVDRKKEIYKNIKGQSVAPQRVENLFRDFEAVKSVFLVGDHKPYNTVLIVPNPDVEGLDLEAMGAAERRDYFRSLVVSVNRFLAPFESIVDFALLDRDFDPERGELTPKGTYRRKAVAENFTPVIDALYRRAHLKMDGLGVELHLPNWLFQVLGLTAGDVRLADGRLTLAPTGASLSVEDLGEQDGGRILRLGSSRYLVRGHVVDLGLLVSTPALWLGNGELARLAPLEDAARLRGQRPVRSVTLRGRAVTFRPSEENLAELRRAGARRDPQLEDLHLAVRMLGSETEEHGVVALRIIGQGLEGEDERLQGVALLALRAAADAVSLDLRRRGFQMLLPVERDAHTPETLARFLGGSEVLLDASTISLLCEKGLTEAKLRAVMNHARRVAKQTGAGDEAHEAVTASLLRFLAEYGAAHPVRFVEIRTALSRIQVFAPDPAVREEAGRSFDRLTQGFRAWLGPAQRIAVDPDEGVEYRWEDVVTFEEGIDETDADRVRMVLSRTNLLREAVFLFSGEALLRLTDIPPGGIWVSLLGKKHGKAVYRVTIHTRLQGSYDFALNLNRDQSPAELAEEIRWLLVVGGTEGRAPLVEKFGGYSEEFDLWSEEFISGETLDRVVQRLARREGEEHDRLTLLWPFFVGSAAGAFIEFWVRTARRYVLGAPSPGDVIVPTHDYQTGTRIISISERAFSPGVGQMLNNLWTYLVVPLEERHPVLAGVVAPDEVLSAFVEAVGVETGLDHLRRAAKEPGPVTEAAAAFVEEVETRGFLPRRLRWAAERFRRWGLLASDAPPPARARTVQELYDTYGLADLLDEYPGTRIRFFRDTVFAEASAPVAEGLDHILESVRTRGFDPDELVDRLSALRVHMEPGTAEEYFLARLTYPHLRPGDEAGFLSTEMGGTRQTDIVVSLEDADGRPYQVRQPVNPKEVGRLHRLFLTAKLDVHFRPEHNYLVAVSERGVLLGGIFFELDEDQRSAHLEKIVVAERYRKAGVSDGLMNEFFNRLRAAGVKTVTTGFFRPSYFYRFGFSVGKRQAGLVKEL